MWFSLGGGVMDDLFLSIFLNLLQWALVHYDSILDTFALAISCNYEWRAKGRGEEMKCRFLSAPSMVVGACGRWLCMETHFYKHVVSCHRFNAYTSISSEVSKIIFYTLFGTLLFFFSLNIDTFSYIHMNLPFFPPFKCRSQLSETWSSMVRRGAVLGAWILVSALHSP